MTEFQTSIRSAIQTRRQGRSLLILLDYDGTLVEIAPHPELARPTPELLEVLGRLAGQADRKVMVVSGRPLSDLQELLPVPGLNLLGSHGGEAFIAGQPYALPVAPIDHKELYSWRAWLAVVLQPFQGWWIEDKPLGFTLHYRQLPPTDAQQFMRVLEGWHEQFRAKARFQVLAGKKVLEILPRGVSKGSAIQEILLLPGFLGFFPIYLGDDITDESAFLILREQGLTIKVGHPATETAASHFLPDPEAVLDLLTLFAFPLEDL